MRSATEEYAARLTDRRATLARLDASDRRLAFARLAVFTVGVFLAWLVF